MTRITLVVALLTLALPTMAVAQGSHSSGPPAAAETEKFIHTAADANTLEIQSSQIALQKTTNEAFGCPDDWVGPAISDERRPNPKTVL
jgi:predicted outer membrane protein